MIIKSGQEPINGTASTGRVDRPAVGREPLMLMAVVEVGVVRVPVHERLVAVPMGMWLAR